MKVAGGKAAARAVPTRSIQMRVKSVDGKYFESLEKDERIVWKPTDVY